MGNNMCPCTIAVGEEYKKFISNPYKFIEINKINQGTLLKTLDGNLDPHYYPLEKSTRNSLKNMMDCNKIQSCRPPIEQCSMEEDMLSDNGDDIEEDID